MRAVDSPPRFVLTGPSGWIGSAMLANLVRWFGAATGNITAFASSARDIALPGGGTLPVRQLKTIRAEDVAGAHVVHLAYLTREKAAELGETTFTATNLEIDDALLGALAEAPAVSLFVASSGAASHAASGQDLHPYGLCKLRQEARFLEWARARGVPAIAGRIFNIAGPWINKLDAYAVSNFAVQALAGNRIEIKADRPVFRSFLHVDDLCELVIKAALAGIGRAAPIDICGSEVLEMQQIAMTVAAEYGETTEIIRSALNLSAPAVYLGNHVDTQLLAMEAGVVLAPFSVQIADTLSWIKANGDGTESPPRLRQKAD